VGRVFLNVLHMDGHITDGEYNSLINKLPQKGSTARSVQAIKSLLESKGYDGIIYPNSVEGEGRNSYVAFHPEQVKPAGAGLVPSEGAKQPVSPSIEEPKFLNRVLGKDVGEADVTTKDFLDFVAREVPSSTFNKIAALEPSAFRGSPEKQFSGAITEGLKQAGVAPDKFGTIQTPRALMQLYEKLGDWKSVYGAIQEYATQSQGQKQNATTPIASPISPRIEEPRAQNFTQFATERGLASDYDVLEHGLLGESGSMSRRAKNFQMEKMSERIQQNKQAHNEYEQAILRGEIVDPEGKLTREGLQKEAKEAELEKPRQQLASIEGQIANIENLGTMSHLANGKLKSRYQRTIDIYNKEKAKIFNDHPELSPSVEESSQGEPDLKDIIRDLPPPKAFDKSLPQAPMSKAEAVSNREVNAENIISDAPSFERHIKEKFQLPPEQARAIAAITDARAETWARKNGKDKAEWYKSRIVGVERGGTVADDALLQREGFREASPEERKGLKIPPAWTEVEIASDPNARLLAVGRDAKGRTQRLYSIAHSEAQLVEKFNRQREFNEALPKLLERIEADAASGRNKEEASVLRLIAQSGFRVGGEADTGAKIKAYGASTLKPEHVKIDSDTVKFDFIGKLGVRQEHEIKDADLARDLRARQESGNPQLFRTNDRAVRAYLNSISGEKSFKVHDFRTWNATEAARKAIEERETPSTSEEYWRARDEVGDIAAKKIGDTRTIALDSYIDPFVFEDWRERAGVEANAQRPRQTRRLQAQTSENERSLRDSPLSSFQQEGKGAVEFLKDGRAIIRAFEKADVSTAAHEVAHIFRRDLDGDLLKDTEQWAGVSNGDWTRGAEEKFARGFERYLRDGLAPTEKLKTVFSQFKDWLTNIYQKLKGSEIDVKISPEMRNVFDKLLGKGESNEQNTKAEDRPIGAQGETARTEIPRAVAAGTPDLSGESERNRSSVPVEEVTGGKVAVTRKERETRGLSPVEQQAYKLAPEAYTEGKARVESNDIDPRRLAESVADKPKPLSYSETGALIYDRARLKNEQKAIYERIGSASGNIRRAEAKDDLARNERDLDLNDQALEKGGREWSMAGQARKAMVKQDYSLAEMVQEYRATTGKEPTLEVRAKLESQAKRIAELEAEMAQKAERDAKREADAALGRIKDDAVRESRRARRATTKQEIDTEWADLKTQFAQARKEIRSGTHPSGLAGLDPEGKLTKIIGQMAKNRVKAGVNTIDGLVDAVHSQVKEFLDDKRAIRDVISGYGKETKPRERLEWEKQLSDLQAQMRELSKQEDVAQGRRESSALKASKTRTQKSIDELNRRIREQDFSKSTRNTIVYDREGNRLKSELQKAKNEFEDLKAKNTKKTIGDYLVRWKRFSVLSYPTTVAKLGTAAAGRMIQGPAEEITGGVLSKIPGISKVAGKAPREGGFSFKAEIEHVKQLWQSDSFKGIMDNLKSGRDMLDLLYGSKRSDTEFLNLPGRVHGAEKSIVKRAEFFRSFEKRLQSAARNGQDISDPDVQMGAAMESYVDAKRAIFMQDNAISSTFNRWMGELSRRGGVAKAASNVGRFIFPITKVPVNYVGEQTSLIPPVGAAKAFGTLAGVGMREATAANKSKVLGAFKGLTFQGLESLKPEEADYVMRAFKKASVGLGIMTLFYMKPQLWDEIDKHLPAWAKHIPLLETAHLAALIRHTRDDAVQKGSNQVEAAAEGGRAAGVSLLKQIPFVEEPAQFYEGVKTSKGIRRMAGDQLRSMIPGAIQQAGQLMDRDEQGNVIKRYPQSLKEEVEIGIPGLRKKVSSVKPRRGRASDAPAPLAAPTPPPPPRSSRRFAN
jgi:DNA topoisomerase-1